MKKKQEEILKQYNKIQEEILKIGWQGIIDKYHPDSNVDHNDSYDLFKLYKLVYLEMKKKLISA